jgi:hypothetical protein
MKKAPKQIINYIKNPETWDSLVFETQIRNEVENSTGALTASDELLVGVLIITMETLIEAQKGIDGAGHLHYYNAGPAASPWYKIRTESLDKAVKILAELGLVARGRPKKTSAPTEIDELFASA